MAKMMGRPPEEVRGWLWDDAVYLLAYCEQENEEMKTRLPTPGAAPPARGPASGSTTTTVYRFAPTPKR
ncbi:hypothetical protein D7X74_07520 [Corallococcus sp. CA047B]|uniref:hypothetical protein n=1 Tax=Corallococcus sp. CA047B TaxID=2316729 RepID=UPI000EA38774|nr:hypothetical protein [Corallococcus sp. CA047B]RKH19130.1 hypothetical protein D7X74_07520 [Corallococcus sp. CA047B]